MSLRINAAVGFIPRFYQKPDSYPQPRANPAAPLSGCAGGCGCTSCGPDSLSGLGADTASTQLGVGLLAVGLGAYLLLASGKRKRG